MTSETKGQNGNSACFIRANQRTNHQNPDHHAGYDSEVSAFDECTIEKVCIRFCAERSRREVGLIIAGACHVSQIGKNVQNQVGVGCDEWYPEIEKIIQSIKVNRNYHPKEG